jgi:glycopeptide antibiotics resistance protein
MRSVVGPTLPLAGALLAMLFSALLGARRGWRPSRTFLVCITIGYAAALVSITIYPIPVQATVIRWERASGGLQNNFVPLIALGQMLTGQPMDVAARQIAGNIVLFAPLGILMPMLRRGVHPARVLLIAAVVSIAIEGSQFLISAVLGFSYKITAVDDVLLNTLGAMLGYSLVTGVRAIRQTSPIRVA